ncbi:MAG: DNA metabolism protein [Pedobacter sp.]|nr:MAG: DNA metabolism protein [Pedobacter sp.]
MIYIFNGSFEGLLTAVFEWHEYKPGKISLMLESSYQPDAFAQTQFIHNNREKADRVWNGLKKKLSYQELRKVYCTYLSEIPKAFDHLFNYICYIFNSKDGSETNFGNEHVIAIAKYARSVEREKHRMEAFIRFKKSKDGFYYCRIDPDFNVLPLISTHFKNRYADQEWLIYDLNRKYGLYYDLNTVEEISMNFDGYKNNQEQVIDEKEEMYAILWKDYFKSTNIVSRKNTKLHVQHVPKRYWRYLTEKQL